MDFVIFIISFLAGTFISSFTLLQVLIILFFGLPTTTAFEKLGYLKKQHNIKRNYLISIILLCSIFLGVSLGLNSLFSRAFVGFVFGVGFALIFGFGKTGTNRNNISDYIETNKDKLTESPEKIIEKWINK